MCMLNPLTYLLSKPGDKKEMERKCEHILFMIMWLDTWLMIIQRRGNLLPPLHGHVFPISSKEYEVEISLRVRWIISCSGPIKLFCFPTSDLQLV